MHKVFVSEGVVLSKRGAGEANTLVSILTREHGLARASARSARRENSKLRYGLEPITLAKFSFIRGRHEWKLTGALDISHALKKGSAAQLQSIARVSKLLLRLIHGEEANIDLYATVVEGFSVIARSADVSQIENIEAVLVLRILSHLGYLPHTQELEPFIKQDFFSLELAAEAAASRKLLIRTINESLGATGL